MKNRNHLIVFICSVLFSVIGMGQSPKKEVLKVVAHFFLAMEERDSVAFNNLFLENAHAYSVRQQGDSTVVRNSILVANTSKNILKERLREEEITVRIDENVAAVWAPYDFWIDGEHSHCGHEVFTLIKKDEVWKIASLTYSVEQGTCNE